VRDLGDEIDRVMAELETTSEQLSIIGRKLASLAGSVRNEFEFIQGRVGSVASGDDEEDEEEEDEGEEEEDK
jgi:hypothetical protein